MAESSKEKYVNENARFILWIYNNDNLRDQLLDDDFLGRVHHHLLDLELTGEQLSKKIKSIARNELLGVKKLAGGGHNSPIVLEALTFEHYSEYVTSRKKTNGSFLSIYSYSGMTSALRHLFRVTGVEMNSDFVRSNSHFMAAMKRTITKAKADLGVELSEGKRPMTFEVYRLMCLKLFEGSNSEYLFAHCFLTLEWNLMARADNIVIITVPNIEWQDDCLLIYYPKSKGNQFGERNDIPLHVYSHPDKPHLCPVLALAKYMFSSPNVFAEENCFLFPGTSQYSRFAKIFDKIIRSNAEEFFGYGGEGR